MKNIIVCLLLVMLSACTNYLYKGQIKAEDSNGKSRDVVIYWTKMSPLIGRDKAGPASLMTECGLFVAFDEQEQGIIFRGDPSRDRFANSQASVNNGDICGRFLNAKRFVEIGSGLLDVSILCTPKEADEFSLFQRTYISAKHSPYQFNITETHRWSLLGNPLQAPSIPECHNAE